MRKAWFILDSGFYCIYVFIIILILIDRFGSKTEEQNGENKKERKKQRNGRRVIAEHHERVVRKMPTIKMLIRLSVSMMIQTIRTFTETTNAVLRWISDITVRKILRVPILRVKVNHTKCIHNPTQMWIPRLFLLDI